jgi:hypothetical protein
LTDNLCHDHPQLSAVQKATSAKEKETNAAVDNHGPRKSIFILRGSQGDQATLITHKPEVTPLGVPRRLARQGQRPELSGREPVLEQGFDESLRKEKANTLPRFGHHV